MCLYCFITIQYKDPKDVDAVNDKTGITKASITI